MFKIGKASFQRRGAPGYAGLIQLTVNEHWDLPDMNGEDAESHRRRPELPSPVT